MGAARAGDAMSGSKPASGVAPARIRLLLADDHTVVRRGLAALLAAYGVGLAQDVLGAGSLGIHAAALAGGTAPLVATALLKAYDNSYVPVAIYIILAAVISLISVAGVRERQGEQLDPLPGKQVG